MPFLIDTLAGSRRRLHFAPRRAFVFGSVLVLATAIAACTRGDANPAGESGAIVPDTFVLGFLPSARADEILPDARRLGDFLGARMGRPVRVVVPSAYEPLLEGFRFGHLHGAFLDGGPGWIVHIRSGAEVILAEQKDGQTYYFAEAFVLRDSPIRTIDDITGKRIAFTSRTGSSGFIMPIGSLIRSGFLRPAGNELTDLDAAINERFASAVTTGGYQQALRAVLDGRADVAFGAHDAPERFLQPAERARIRVLHRFGRIPSHAVLVAGNLDSAVVASFRDAMLALNDSANLPLLRAIYGVDALEPANTQEHLGDFGAALSEMPGMQRTLLARRPD
jgi:phosphonate transport system substrate-binding protein